VLVTPEIVRPVPQGEAVPEVHFPRPLQLSGAAAEAPRTPGLDKTGPVPVTPAKETVPVEQLLELRKAGQTPAAAMPAVQFVPVAVPAAATQPANPGLTSAPGPAPSPLGGTAPPGR